MGGGIIGLSLAIELRKQRATVLVVDRGEPGREASHAAGGMLVDCSVETVPALQALTTASARMYPEFAQELEVESGNAGRSARSRRDYISPTRTCSREAGIKFGNPASCSAG